MRQNVYWGEFVGQARTHIPQILLKISLGKTHLENVRYVNKGSKKRILVEFICLSWGKQGFFSILKGQKKKQMHAKVFGSILSTSNYGLFGQKGGIFLSNPHIPNKNSDRGKNLYRNLSLQIWDFWGSEKNQNLYQQKCHWFAHFLDNIFCGLPWRIMLHYGLWTKKKKVAFQKANCL